MKTKYRFRNKLYVVSDLVVDNIYNHKKLFFLHILCFIAGVILGFIFQQNLNSAFYVYDFTNHYYNIIFNIDISIISIFFDRVLINLQLFIVIFIFSLHFVATPLHYLFTLYRSYILTATCIIIISMYGVLGIVNTILLIIPQQLITMFFLVNFNKNSISQRYINKKTLRNVFFN